MLLLLLLPLLLLSLLMLMCVCVCVCERARVCVLKLHGCYSAPKPIILSGSSSIPPSLTASRTPSMPALTAYALFRLADLQCGQLFYNRLLRRLLGSGLPSSRCSFP